MYDFSSLNRLLHTARIIGLHANHFNLRTNLFDKRCYACCQTAAANRHKNRIDIAVLAEDFHADSSLTCNHIRIIKRRDISQFFLFCQLHRIIIGIVVRHTFQYHFATSALDRVNFDFGRCFRHHDDGAATQILRRQSHTLRMVARACCNHAAIQGFFRQFRHFIVRAADFERKHRLQIFTFEQNLIVQTAWQTACQIQRRFYGHIINGSGQNTG